MLLGWCSCCKLSCLPVKRKQEKGKEKSLLAFPAPLYHLPFSLLFWLDTGQVSTGCFAFVGCTVLQFLPALGSEPDGGVPSALELTCCLKPPHTGTRQYWGLTLIFSWPAFLLLSHWIILFSPGFSVANKEGLQKGTCVWPIHLDLKCVLLNSIFSSPVPTIWRERTSIHNFVA